MNSPEYSLSERNASLAKRLQGLYLTYGKEAKELDFAQRFYIMEAYGAHLSKQQKQSLIYQFEQYRVLEGEPIQLRSYAQKISLALTRALTRKIPDNLPTVFQRLSSEFSFPVFGAQINGYLPNYQPRQTLFGFLTGIFIGADNRLYSIEETHSVFNLSGQGLHHQKLELMFEQRSRDENLSLDDQLGLCGLEASQVTHVDFDPSRLRHRMAPPTESDYQILERILSDIKNRRFVIG